MAAGGTPRKAAVTRAGVFSMSEYHLMVLTVILHALTVGFACFVGIFYFAPDKIVFGVQASVIIGLVLSTYNFISPNLTRFFGWTDWYLGLIVRHTCPILAWSCVVIAIATCWMAVMFGTIVQRYKYLDAVNRAISVIGSNQLALPAPEDLAAAFNVMPQRPEVAFILMRAARLLSFDDSPQNYYAYVGRFISNVDKDAIIAKFSTFHRPTTFAIDVESSALPLLDPIQTLSNFAIENESPSFDLKWAIKILKQYRDTADDTELKLWRTILETEESLTDTRDAAGVAQIRESAIKSIRSQIEPQSGGANFRALSFAADHLYQEALDYLAWLYAGGPEFDAKLPVPCDNADKVVPTMQRILLLRSRLMTRTDLLWWRSPTKLSMYYLYLYLGGQKGKYSIEIYNLFNTCPKLMDQIKELHSAIAFKQFQEPESWLYGTPLSPTLNGSASITLLRQWVRQGW